MASIVKTPSGKFKAIIRKQGRLLKTKTFSRKTDAKAWAARIEGDREMLAAYGIGGASMPFRELADEYDAQWNGDSRIRSQLVYLREKLGNYTLMNIDKFVVKGVIAEYAEGEVLRYNGSEKLGYQLKKTGKPRAASTINCLRARLSAIFLYAIENDYVTSNPVAGTKTWTLNNKRERFLSDEERSRLLDICRQSEWPRLYLLVLMALTSRDSYQRLDEVEEIYGLAGNDLIDLTSYDYSLSGQSITVDGGVGNDILWGSDANEALIGGEGNDNLFGGSGSNTLTGGLGADEFQFTKTSTQDTLTDFNIAEGDSLKFFNTDGASFDIDSLVLSGTALSINYAFNEAITLELQNISYNLSQIEAAIVIV